MAARVLRGAGSRMWKTSGQSVSGGEGGFLALPRGRRVSEAGGPQRGRRAGGGCVGQGTCRESWPEEGARHAQPPARRAAPGRDPAAELPRPPAAALARRAKMLPGGAGRAGAAWDATGKGAFEGKTITHNGSPLSRLLAALFSVGKLPSLDRSCQKTTLTLDHVFLYLVP